jgi:hypothetical protein
MKYPFKSLILIIVSVLATAAYAQKAKVKFYPEGKITEKRPGMINRDKEYRYAQDEEYEYWRKIVDNSDKTFFLEKIDKRNAQVIWRKELVLTPEDKKIKGDFPSIEALKDGFLLVFKHLDVKTKSVVISARKVDENLNPLSERKVVYTKKGGEGIYIRIKRKGNYIVIVSDTFGSSSKNTGFLFKVIDLDLNLIWEKSITPSKTYYHRLEALTLDKELNLVAVYKYGADGKVLGYGGDNQDCMMLRYNYKKDALQTQMLNLGKHMSVTYGLQSGFDTLNNLIEFYGGYNTNAKAEGAQGIFNFEYDMNTLQPVTEALIPYSDEVLKFYKAKPEKGQFIPYLSIKNKIRDESGSVTFVMQKTYSATATGPNSTMTPDSYYYGDILLMNILPAGKHKWTQIIRRDTETSGSYTDYYRILSFSYNDITYLAFNASDYTALSPDKDFGYNLSAAGNNTLLLLGYDKDGKQVVSQTITPKGDKELWCNISTIKLSNGNRLGLTFEVSGAVGKVSSRLNAAVEIE